MKHTSEFRDLSGRITRTTSYGSGPSATSIVLGLIELAGVIGGLWFLAEKAGLL